MQQDLPEAERARYEIKGESSIRGHIKVNEEEQGGSSGYVPPDRAKDTQIIWAAKFLRGEVSRENRARALPCRRSPRSPRRAPILASRPRRRTEALIAHECATTR